MLTQQESYFTCQDKKKKTFIRIEEVRDIQDTTEILYQVWPFALYLSCGTKSIYLKPSNLFKNLDHLFKMDQEKNQLEALASITSKNNRLDAAGHQVDLHAVTSHPISIGDVGSQLTSEQKFIILRRLNYEGLTSLEDLPVTATFMIEKIELLPESEAIEILKEALVEYRTDSNFPITTYALIEKLLNEPSAGGNITYLGLLDKKEDKEKSSAIVDHSSLAGKSSASLEADEVDFLEIFDWSLQVKMEAALIAYHSPYPEVRSVSEPYDDPTMYCETVRVYILGIIWTAIGSVVNTFFETRNPGISLPTAVVQIFLLPCGQLLAAILPKWKFKVWKFTFDLNPGPWNFKEQMLATIFYSVSGGTPYVTSNIHVQKLHLFYNNQWADFGYQVLLILSTQFMGFGFAGIMRRFAVYPTKAVWPTLLPTLALSSALVKPEKKSIINGWKISRYYFFLITFAASFLYYWLPDYLMQFLSRFNWITWISPMNQTLAEITGSVGGLGINPITSFDFNIILFSAPMVLPWYSFVSQYAGSIIAFFCIVGVYYSNHLWTGYLPINSNRLFTNTGQPYDVKAIVNSESLFDRAKYEEIGPPYYSAANLVLYGAFFAIYPFAIIYECAIRWEELWVSMKGIAKSVKNIRRSTFADFKDPHTTMMTQYKEVPDWAFLIILIISIVLAIICVEIYPAETPVWGIFFTVGINLVFLIPLTAIVASTGFGFGLNVLVELIIGYALPGNGLALNFLKALGYNIDGQAQNYISDQKMAHYVKIPPRALFRCQVLSTFIACFIALGITNFKINTMKDYCLPTQEQNFSCPGVNTFYTASIIWGVIGPKKVFNGLYPILQWCFLIGALLPIPCLLFKRFGPRSWTRSFQPTLIIGGFLIYAPYNLSYYTMGLYTSIFFMYYVRRHFLSWWEKYNYILYSGLNAGFAFAGIIIFFAVEYHDKSINWWGNTVSYAGMDAYISSVGRLNATLSAPDGYFGIRKGNYP